MVTKFTKIKKSSDIIKECKVLVAGDSFKILDDLMNGESLTAFIGNKESKKMKKAHPENIPRQISDL